MSPVLLLVIDSIEPSELAACLEISTDAVAQKEGYLEISLRCPLVFSEVRVEDKNPVQTGRKRVHVSGISGTWIGRVLSSAAAVNALACCMNCQKSDWPLVSAMPFARH